MARRELKTRNRALAQSFAKWVGSTGLTPNQISIASIFFALLAGGFFIMFPHVSGLTKWILPVVAAICIQLRLLCNLIDGMVAIEGGKSTPAGELFNDIPDRFADCLFLVPVGYAASMFSPYAVTLGWVAALLAVGTAYVRTLISSVGAPANFCGPMAKPHRMFVLTVACLLTALTPVLGIKPGFFLFYVLVLVSIGSLITLIRRIIKGYRFLERSNA